MTTNCEHGEQQDEARRLLAWAATRDEQTSRRLCREDGGAAVPWENALNGCFRRWLLEQACYPPTGEGWPGDEDAMMGLYRGKLASDPGFLAEMLDLMSRCEYSSEMDDAESANQSRGEDEDAEKEDAEEEDAEEEDEWLAT